MSKIALEPNASGTGTFTIASPNSNTSRTLTLPDADGALLTDGSSLNAGNLTGTLPAIDGSALTGIGGATLLGTIATTSGTSVTLSGLDLTGYTHLQLIVDGVSSDQATQNHARINNQNFLYVTASGTADYVTGSGFIHIPTGVFWFAGGLFYSGFPEGLGRSQGGSSGLTSASTSITLTLEVGNFDAGSIKVYGVA